MKNSNVQEFERAIYGDWASDEDYMRGARQQSTYATSWRAWQAAQAQQPQQGAVVEALHDTKHPLFELWDAMWCFRRLVDDTQGARMMHPRVINNVLSGNVHRRLWEAMDAAEEWRGQAPTPAAHAPSEPTDTEQDLIVRLWEAWNGDVNAGTQFIPNPNDPSTIGASTADAMWRVERFVRSLIASKQADTERMRREIKRLRRAVHDLVDGLDDDDVAVIEAAKELVDSRTGDHLTDDGHNSVTICPHALAGLEECVEAIRERDEAAVDAAMKQQGGGA